MERRWIDGALEVRAEGEGGGTPRRLVGYASVFGVLSQVIWGFRERVAPGAFAETLQDDIRALWNHDTAYVLGRTTAGTLKVGEDKHGLWVEITPPETPLVESFLASVERGDVSQMSIGFRALEDEWDEDEDGQLIRTVTKIKLYEVSPVTFPAFTETEVSTRSVELYGDRPERPAGVESNGRAPDEIEREAELRAQAEQRERMVMRVRIMEVGDGHY
jgi:HK97 family phage prohead protease